MANGNLVFVGIKGCVVALDRATGSEVWLTELTGNQFVNVMLGNGEVYAATKGEIFCLDESTGQIRWRNPLKGLGWGLVSIACPGAQGNNVMAMFEKRRRDEEQAAAAAGA